MIVQVDSTWTSMYIVAEIIAFLIFMSTQPKLTNIMSSFRSTQPKWVDSLAQHTLIFMETTRRVKYNLVLINLSWLLGVQMDNIILTRLSQNFEYCVDYGMAQRRYYGQRQGLFFFQFVHIGDPSKLCRFLKLISVIHSNAVEVRGLSR